MGEDSKKVLIIEDEKFLARALELKLVHEGFGVTILPNGQNILATIEKDNFSVVICDLMMPRIDGFKVLQIFKENKIKIPVIILTNLAQPDDEKRVRELGAVDFLIKSDTPLSVVVEKIKQQIK